MSKYTNRTDAIEIEIIQALGEHADDFDIEAIADEVLGDHNDDYRCIVDAPTFWEVVERHEL